MTPTDKLITHAGELAAAFDENFLELAKTLRQLRDIGLEEFRLAVAEAGMGMRKAYCLLRIDRAFGSLKVSKTRLRKVGWTKLNLLAGHTDGENHLGLIELAEAHTAKELDAILREEDPAGKRRTVVLHLSQFQYEMLSGILLSFGARRTPRGMVNREAAVMEIALWAHEELENLPEEGSADDEWEESDEDVMDDAGQVMPDVLASAIFRVLAQGAAQRDHLQEEVNRLERLVEQLRERDRHLASRGDPTGRHNEGRNDNDSDPDEEGR